MNGPGAGRQRTQDNGGLRPQRRKAEQVKRQPPGQHQLRDQFQADERARDRRHQQRILDERYSHAPGRRAEISLRLQAEFDQHDRECEQHTDRHDRRDNGGRETLSLPNASRQSGSPTKPVFG